MTVPRRPPRGTKSLYSRQRALAIQHFSLNRDLTYLRGVDSEVRITRSAYNLHVRRALNAVTTSSTQRTKIKYNDPFPSSTTRLITTLNLRRRIRVLPHHGTKTGNGNRQDRLPNNTRVFLYSSNVRRGD